MDSDVPMNFNYFSRNMAYTVGALLCAYFFASRCQHCFSSSPVKANRNVDDRFVCYECNSFKCEFNFVLNENLIIIIICIRTDNNETHANKGT